MLQRSGALRALEAVRTRPALLVINHHRIGDPDATSFDRGVFSATEAQFDRQIRYLRRHFPIVWGEELQELVSGARPLTRTHVAITFDDGYLDNYRLAFPILRSHGVSAAFFLISDYVGTAAVPWWDEIAFLIRQTAQPQLELTGLGSITVPNGPDREDLIRLVLRQYKRSDAASAATLLEDLRHTAQCPLPAPRRRFLDWSEAREMAHAGMVIGSHTQSHRILARLSPEQQQHELQQSKLQIEHQIGLPVRSLSYPVGIHGTFDETTERLARDAGYTLCFSFYGGLNLPGNLSPGNVHRGSVAPEHLLFRTETLLQAALGKSPF